jgi:hypothetical protein
MGVLAEGKVSRLRLACLMQRRKAGLGSAAAGHPAVADKIANQLEATWMDFWRRSRER